MIKPEKIIEVQPFYIICKFNNGEVRKLVVKDALAEHISNIWVQNILNPDTFSTVKIGDVGQLYWKDAAEMKDENGNTIKCEYDLSPEFIYHKSIVV